MLETFFLYEMKKATHQLLVFAFQGFASAYCKCMDVVDKKITTGFQASKIIAVGEIMKFLDSQSSYLITFKRIYQSSYYNEILSGLLEVLQAIANKSQSSIIRYGWTINSILNRLWIGPNDESDESLPPMKYAGKNKNNKNKNSDSSSSLAAKQNKGNGSDDVDETKFRFQTRRIIHQVSESLAYSIGRSLGTESVQSIAERAYSDLFNSVISIDFGISASFPADAIKTQESVTSESKANNKRSREDPQSISNSTDLDISQENSVEAKSKKAKLSNTENNKIAASNQIRIFTEFLITCISTIRACILAHGHFFTVKLRHNIETTLISYLQALMVGGSYICKSYQTSPIENKIAFLRKVMSTESDLGEALLCESLKTLFSCLSAPIAGNNESKNISLGLKIFESGIHHNKSSKVVEISSMSLNALAMIIRPRMLPSISSIDDEENNLLTAANNSNDNEIERFVPSEDDLQLEIAQKTEGDDQNAMEEDAIMIPNNKVNKNVNNDPNKEKIVVPNTKKDLSSTQTQLSNNDISKQDQTKDEIKAKDFPKPKIHIEKSESDEEADDDDENDSNSSDDDSIPDIV